VLCGIFLIASQIGKLLRSYQEYPAKSVGKQAKGRISDSGASKKLAGFFIWNLVKLVNSIPGKQQHAPTLRRRRRR
jgi:hypothetical protein